MKTLRDAVMEGLLMASQVQRFPKLTLEQAETESGKRAWDQALTVWCQMLQSHSPEAVGRAFARHRARFNDWPTPAEILALVGPEASGGNLAYELPDYVLGGVAKPLGPRAMTTEERDAIKAEMSEGGRKLLEGLTEGRRIGFRRAPNSKIDDNPPKTRTDETEELARRQIEALKLKKDADQ